MQSRRPFQPNDLRRPALLYFGGKWRIAPWIIRHFPAHKVYVEPFGGGGSVLIRKPPSAIEVYNDLDGDLVNFFRVLRQPILFRGLFRALRRTAYARSELMEAFGPTDDSVERARRLAVRSMMSFHPRAVFGERTPFKMRSKQNNAVSWTGYVRHLSRVAARLRTVTIEQRDALEVMDALDAEDTLFYVDPPYVSNTRTSRAKYRHELSNDDQRVLLAKIKSLRGMVILSGYDNELYRDTLEGWCVRHMTTMVSNSPRPRQETIWMSPNVPTGSFP